MKKPILSSLFILSFFTFLWNCSNPSNIEKQSSENTPSTVNYLDKGKQIAALSFATLSQRLQKAIQEGGIPNAIQYCNLAAHPITDSLSNAHQATIRRTSLKYRNASNQPTELEQTVLEEYAKNMEQGLPLQPILKQIGQQEKFFFAPILIQEPCLNCHGKLSENIVESNYQLLKNLYPEDKAIGYNKGELRGIWSIQFLDK